jgi:hypothetical protein
MLKGSFSAQRLVHRHRVFFSHWLVFIGGQSGEICNSRGETRASIHTCVDTAASRGMERRERHSRSTCTVARREQRGKGASEDAKELELDVEDELEVGGCAGACESR